MKILVTGATGFIGGALVRRLLSEGSDVRVQIRNLKSANELKEAGAEIFEGDITDPSVCSRAVNGVDVVFHCAGVLGGWGKPEKLFWDVNYQGTKNMLEAARDAKVKRFIHFSTCGIFGPLKKDETPADERSYNPTNIYEKTKAEAEKLALGYAKNGLPLVVVRPEFVYGPGDMHLLPFFRSVKRRSFLFFDKGTALVHPTYIDDLVDGVMLAAENKEALGKAFNLAGEKPVTIKEFVDSMSDAIDVPRIGFSVPATAGTVAATIFDCTIGLVVQPPLTRAQVGFLSNSHASSIKASKEVLGYSPKIGIEEGIRRTVGWYRENGLL